LDGHIVVIEFRRPARLFPEGVHPRDVNSMSRSAEKILAKLLTLQPQKKIAFGPSSRIRWNGIPRDRKVSKLGAEFSD
jgi:hypothetical protein